MANYTPSNLVNAQAKLIQKFQSNELRFREPNTFKSLLATSQIMFPDHKELRTREDRAVDAKYTLRSSRALTNVRAHNHAGVKGDSATLTPSWLPYADKFKTSLKTADNNVFNKEEILANEFANVVANMAEGHETTATAFLSTNRSGVNNATQEGTFDALNDVFEIASADEDRAPQITQSVMEVNKHSGQYVYYCDTVAFNKFQKQASQGSGNSVNLGFNFMGQTFVHSVELGALAAAIDVTYVSGFWIAVPVGATGILDWIPKQNREGIDTKVNSYSTILNPVDGLNYALHNYVAREDGTATNGMTQDVKTEWEASVDLAFEVAPDSTAGETPLLAHAIV